MKLKHAEGGHAGYWLKLSGALIAAGIVVVLVFGGIQNIVQQISDLQIELDATSRQLAEANGELRDMADSLETTQSDLTVKGAELETAYSDLAEALELLDETKLQLAQVSEELAETAAALVAVESDLTVKIGEFDQLQADLAEAGSEIENLSRAKAVTDLELTAKTDELIAAEIETKNKHIELEQLKSELEESQGKSYSLRSALLRTEAKLDTAISGRETAYLYSAQFQAETRAHLWTHAYASCIVEEYSSLAHYVHDQDREFTAEQSERFELYLAQLIPDDEFNPVSEYCNNARLYFGGFLDEASVAAAAEPKLAEEAGMSPAQVKVEIGKFTRATEPDDTSTVVTDRAELIWQEILPTIEERIVGLLGEEVAERVVKLDGGTLFLLTNQ